MKMLAMPSPMTRRIHSSKFCGFPVAVAQFTFASTRPLRQLICGRVAAGGAQRQHEDGVGGGEGQGKIGGWGCVSTGASAAPGPPCRGR